LIITLKLIRSALKQSIESRIRAIVSPIIGGAIVKNGKKPINLSMRNVK
jgi:hypothetical protein